MKKLLSTLAVTAALTASAQAGSIIADVTVGYDSYLPISPTGSVDTYTLDGTLGLTSNAQSSLYVEFDHLLPIIPNIRYEQNSLAFTGTVTQTVTISGQTYTANANSVFSWNHQDAIFYWGVPFSTWLPMIDAADFGLGLKLGDMSMGVDQVFDTAFPFGAVYGYGRIHVSPPLLGLGFELQAKYMDYSATEGQLTFSEMTYKIDWMLEAPIPVIDLSLGVEAGYRSMSHKLTANGVGFDLGFNGYFFGVVGKFGI